MVIAAKKSITLPDSEQQQMQDLERALRRGVPAFVTSTGERIELPGTVFGVLRTAVGFMPHGQAVTLVPDNQAITTQRAADTLGMSRPFFIKQLEAGLMAHHRVGNQRRVYLRDVLEFAKKRDEERLAALDRLSRDTFEAGLYDRNVLPKHGTDECSTTFAKGGVKPGHRGGPYNYSAAKHHLSGILWPIFTPALIKQ